MMSDSISTPESTFQFPRWLSADRNNGRQRRRDALTAELLASHAREDASRKENRDLSQHQAMMAQEFEHRVVNGLQLIASLLSLQSRTAKTPEAACQLTIAAHRVVALGRVHHRLHLPDRLENVEFKQFLVQLCEDLSGVLFQERTDHAIVVEGAQIEIPTMLASPLGFIVNELITNSVKYAKGNITVRIEETAPAGYSLSVLDDGPGLPAGFEPENSNGLGLKLVLSLVNQIGGELQIVPRDNGRAARITVAFCSPLQELRSP
jgi:two-component sensor histidine kinase